MQTVETLNEGLKRAYTVTITSKDIDARVEKEVKAIAPQVRMPGFLPGKVPANLVKKMHGESLQRDALNNSIQESIQKLIADQKLRPAMQPSVELDEGFEFGQDAEVKVELEVLPEIEAPSIEGLKLERLTVDVADDKVAEAAGRIASQQGVGDVTQHDLTVIMPRSRATRWSSTSSARSMAKRSRAAAPRTSA